MHTLVGYALFPVVFVCALASAMWGIQAPINRDLLIGSIGLAVALIIALFERLLPEHPQWNAPHGDTRTDCIHLLISMIIIPKILDVGMQIILLSVAVWLAAHIGQNLWPTDWSLLPQLVLALLISQFGEYWAHRAMHEIPYLWRFHAIHHSPERLYWLNAARFHPVDTAILLIISMAPLIILGAGPDILILLTVWMSTHGMFQHCNIRVRLGPLNYVFSMAELHRWHHALAPEQSNANYGNNILIWDLIFGTVYYPKDKLPSRHIGLRNGADFPKGYGAQILSPWRSDKQGQEHPP
jgi:sterol desaturase/sphingolipid hydroxylase (fatty acid hydroxylase superfamily)